MNQKLKIKKKIAIINLKIMKQTLKFQKIVLLSQVKVNLNVQNQFRLDPKRNQIIFQRNFRKI